MNKKVVPFPKGPTTGQMMAQIAELAVVDLNILLTRYSLRRVNERVVSRDQILDAVKNGTAEGQPYFNPQHQEWRLKMSRVTAGDRVTIVVTIEDGVLVITVWKR